MLLRAMHDHGCDDIYIIVTDLKRQEMDDVTEYFKLVCRYAYGGRTRKPSIASQIQYDRSSSIPRSCYKASFILHLAQTCGCVTRYSSGGAHRAFLRSTSLSEQYCTKKNRHSSSCSPIRRPPTPKFSSHTLSSYPQRISSSTSLADARTPAAMMTVK